MESSSQTGRPSASVVVWVKTQPSLTSRVRAGWPSVLPARPQHGQQLAGAGVVIARRVSTGAGCGARLGCRGRQETPEDGRTGAVHRSAHQRLDSLQIQLARLAAAAEDHFQQSAYFLSDLALGRFGRSFSWGVRLCSNGRSWQICSLTCTKA